MLDQQAAQVGVEDALLKAIAWRESSWLMVDAPDGGMGVMQLMPDTVRWLQSTYVPGAWDPHDLTANIHAGAEMLLLYSRLYGGDVAKIAAAYHGGMGAVDRRRHEQARDEPLHPERHRLPQRVPERDVAAVVTLPSETPPGTRR